VGANVNLVGYDAAVAADVSVQADVNLAALGVSKAGLVARYTGSGDNDMYLGELVGTNGTYAAVIYRNVGGTWTQLASSAVATGAGTLGFQVFGNSLKLFLNGVLVTSALDSAIQGPGLVGIRAITASIDNFSADLAS